jgi:hypothetical protein
MSEDNENKIPKDEKNNKIKRSNEKPLDINLVKITDDIIKGDPNNQEELKKKIRELKTKIKQEFNISTHRNLDNGSIALNLELDSLNSTIAQIFNIFQGKDWLREFEQKISIDLPSILEPEKLPKTIEIKPIHSPVEVSAEKNLKKESKTLLKANADLNSMEYDLKNDIQKLKSEAQQVKHVLIALKDYSIDAIKDKSYDKAIEILQNTDEKLLPKT